MPSDLVRVVRDKLRKLRQVTSVSKYLSEFRNLVLTTLDFIEWEKSKKNFKNELKYNMKIEVLKSPVPAFEEAQNGHQNW